MSSNNYSQTYQIQGLHCGACVARVNKTLSPFAKNVIVTLEPPRVTIEGAETNLQTLQNALSKIGDYTLLPLDVAPQKTKFRFGFLPKSIYLVIGIVIVLLIIGLTL